MATSNYFSRKVQTEANLWEDIIIESIKIYGQDVYYLPRTIAFRNNILQEDVESEFNDAHIVEMYIENTEGFEGEGNIFQKFGLEIRDEATFIVARRTWQKLIGNNSNGIHSIRPAEGDLIYLPLSKSFFEVSFVEHEQPFYQLNNLTMYKLQCTLYEHNDEDFNTGVEELDSINKMASTLSVRVGEVDHDISIGTRYEQVLPDGTEVTGKIVDVKYQNSLPHFIFLADVETSDGDYHEFVPSENGDTSTYLTDGVGYIEVIECVDLESPNNDELFFGDPAAQNSIFQDEANSIVDFSEDNPFGEV